MKIEEIKVDDLMDLMQLFKPQSNVTKQEHNGEEIRIVILQRGWVVVGKFYQKGTECWVENGYVIRCWGTDKGLGQLAIEGKQESTILDPIPVTKFHELVIVATMTCDKSLWKDLCK